MTRPRFLLPAAVLGLLILPTAARAQTSTWTGANGINWNGSLNWSPTACRPLPVTSSFPRVPRSRRRC
jgi:hypothetical protein